MRCIVLLLHLSKLLFNKKVFTTKLRSLKKKNILGTSHGIYIPTLKLSSRLKLHSSNFIIITNRTFHFKSTKGSRRVCVCGAGGGVSPQPHTPRSAVLHSGMSRGYTVSQVSQKSLGSFRKNSCSWVSEGVPF